MYTVLCGTYVSGMEGQFEVTIQSNDPVVFDQIWPAEEEADFGDTAIGRMAARAAKKVRVLSMQLVLPDVCANVCACIASPTGASSAHMSACTATDTQHS